MTITYCFEQGMRRVLPYHLNREINVKGRWVGKTVVDLLDSELAIETKLYTRELVSQGKIQLIRKANAKRCAEVFTDWESLATEPILQGDVLNNVSHVHEPPIPVGVGPEGKGPGVSLEVVYEDATLMVVNKPSGVPVHPTASYYWNTVTEIVRARRESESVHKAVGKEGSTELSLVAAWTGEVYPVHRLDKLTSGVLILGKTAEQAKRFCEAMREREVDKVYFARVEGDFREVEETTAEEGLAVGSPAKRTAEASSNREGAIKRVAQGNGIQVELSASVVFDGVEVEAPRATLSDYAGFFPHRSVIHTTNNKHNFNTPSQLAETYFKHHSYNSALNQSIVLCKPVTGRMHQIRIHLKELGYPIANDPIYNPRAHPRKGVRSGEVCGECGTPLYLDAKASEMVLWLHSWRYRLKDSDKLWQFETATPRWVSFEE